MPRRGVAGLLAVVALAGAGQAATGSAARRPGRGDHTVARGETLSHVAARFKVTVEALAKANGIADPHRVRAGSRLAIPGREAAAPAPPALPPAAPPSFRLPEQLRRSPDRLALVPHFDAAARDFGVPADLLKALAWQESGWQNGKVSSAKALGIGQLVPATVQFVNEALLRQPLDPRRPADNIRMSARFLAYLLAQTKGHVPTALAAYFQGLASVRRDGPSPRARRYVANVEALRPKFT